MLQTAYLALGVGATMVGVGLALQYQGEALKKSEQTQDIGKKSFRAGVAWQIFGGAIFLVGFILGILTPLGIIH